MRGDGLDCPAAGVLCLCGIRDCPDYALHRDAFVVPARRRGNRMRSVRFAGRRRQ